MGVGGYELISADSHVVEPPDLFEARVAAGVRDRVPRLVSSDSGSVWLVGDEQVELPATAAAGSGYRLTARTERSSVSFDEVLPGLHNPVERLRLQDFDSVNAEVLYPSPGLWDAIGRMGDAELRSECVRAYNDWIGEFCAHSPERLIGLGKIPSTGVDDASAELRRCVEELGLRGVVLDGWPSGGVVPASEADDPFWEVVEDLRVPVSVHFAMGGGRETLPPGGIAPGMKPPMADAVLPMVAGGVFDRFPNVQMVFAHGDAGWVVHWLEFMDINYVRHRHLSEYALADPEAVPSEYIRRNSFFTFHHDRSAVKNRSRIGGAHLLWASHFPYDDGNWPDNREQSSRVTEEVPAGEREGLLATNTARLYRLPGYEDGFADGELNVFDRLVNL